jgi:phosphate-selective porin
MHRINRMQWVWAVIVLCAIAYPAAAQNDFRGPYSIPFGEVLTVNPRVRIQLDFNGFRPELADRRKIFQRRRLRFGADGTLFRDFEYRIRVETKQVPEFRDVFIRFHRVDSIQVQGGRFKIPFGLDQLQNAFELDFVHRSRIGSLVAPGRDAGGMVLGNLLENKIQYSAGIFRHDGRNTEVEDFASPDETRPGGNRTLAARMTFEPASLLSLPKPIRHLQVGAAVTRSQIPNGLGSLPGMTVSRQVFFPRMYVNGTRLRRGAELSATVGSLSLQGEFMDAREQRLGQGLNDEDLPPLRTQGWYISAVHPLFGHLDSTDQNGFLASVLPIKGMGRVDAAARYEMIRFGSVSGNGAAPGRSSRSANVVGNQDRAWTLGLNWHASPYLKLQFNGVHETLLDPVNTPIEGETRYWTIVGRLQFSF